MNTVQASWLCVVMQRRQREPQVSQGWLVMMI